MTHVFKVPFDAKSNNIKIKSIRYPKKSYSRLKTRVLVFLLQQVKYYRKPSEKKLYTDEIRDKGLK